VSVDLLVTGANGFIGGRLAALALRRGLRVRTLTRRDWPGEPFVAVDERRLGWLPHGIPDGVLDGVRCVVHCAALTRAGSEAEARAINVEGTRRLAELAAKAGAKRFVFVSSQSARKDAAAAYGRTKHEAEEALLGIAGLDPVVVRPGLVCGPGSHGLYARLSGLVDRLPIVPLLGGGRALVQPIHVDDLCAALLSLCDANLGVGGTLSLGDPVGLTLAAFLDEIAVARLGRARRHLPVPIAPFLAVATAAESVGVTLPVTRANLLGLSAVERMDTSADMRRLGVSIRPVADIVAPDRVTVVTGSTPMSSRSAGILLIGAGRIGLAHATTATRRHGAHLRAMVDLNRKAFGLLRGLGVSAPSFTSIDEAFKAGGIDAAVVATPASSHLPLAKRCVERGLVTLVEKPLALSGRDLDAWRQLDAGLGAGKLLVGYLAPRAPHAAAALARLRAGDFGTPGHYVGFTLLSFVEGPDAKRWETDPARSGGGVLANAAGHVVSLATTAFGEPTDVAATLHRRWSNQVEDSACLELKHAGLSGQCLASWSITGFARQENTLVVTTDRGTLTIANDAACFEEAGRVEVLHQLDYDLSFNLFPDYAGGGISAEQADVQATLRRGVPPPMGIGEALEVERVLARAYALDHHATFDRVEVPVVEPLAKPIPASELVARRCLLDLRDEDPAEVASGLPKIGVVVAASAARELHARGALGESTRVTVPDFARQARMLAAGRPLDLLRDMGVGGAAGAARAAVPAVLRERGATFWAAAEALLGASLAAIHSSFRGTLLIHPYLTDLAKLE